MNRRKFLTNGSTLLAGILVAKVPLQVLADHHGQGAQKHGYEIPKLSYGYDALEPHIDKRTMEIHYGKHHQGYVNKLNAAVADHHTLAEQSIEDLLRNIDKVPMKVRQAVINSGGGHANHTLFWSTMIPDGRQLKVKLLKIYNLPLVQLMLQFRSLPTPQKRGSVQAGHGLLLMTRRNCKSIQLKTKIVH